MRILLELLRIIVIFFLYGALGMILVRNVYAVSEVTEKYSWLGFIAVLLLLFVYYRNNLQFKGWYKGKGRKKLPKPVTRSLIMCSIALLLTPFIIHSIKVYF